MRSPSALGFSVIAVVALIILSAIFAQDVRAAERLGGVSRFPPSVLDVRFGCKLIEGKLVCGKDIETDNGDGGTDSHKKQKKKKKDQGNPGERSCPPGYVVLDKPNKYGAFCEPVDTSKSAPAKEAEKCKFGMVGTPPNCACPEGTKFFGYKGCLHTLYCSGWHSNEYAAEQQKTWIPKCKAQSGIPDCHAVTRPGVVFECCCY